MKAGSDTRTMYKRKLWEPQGEGGMEGRRHYNPTEKRGDSSRMGEISKEH